MGAKGSKVQKITTDFNVQIKFPDKAVENGGGEEVNGDGRSTNPNIIKITGKKDNCEGASKALLELVPITAEVSVPYEFHRSDIETRFLGLELLLKLDAKIN